MSIRKYFTPANYWNKLILYAVKPILYMGIPLTRTTQVGGVTLKFVASSFLEFFLRAREDFSRHPATVSWICNTITKDDVVYDIGANVGGFSCFIGKKVSNGQGMVYAFEPAASNLFSLVRNIKLNGLSKKVIAYSIAFGDHSGVGSLHCSSIIPGTSIHSTETDISREFEQGVMILTCEEFVKSASVCFPNHIKIDVDGAEESIIQGMSNLLSDSRLKSVMVEVEGKEAIKRITLIFEQFGFKEELRDLKPREELCDILYVRTSH